MSNPAQELKGWTDFITYEYMDLLASGVLHNQQQAIDCREEKEA